MKNVGSVDRVIRLLIGVILVALFFVLPKPLNWLGLIAIIPLGTAAINFCPLYKLFGINTCRRG